MRPLTLSALASPLEASVSARTVSLSHSGGEGRGEGGVCVHAKFRLGEGAGMPEPNDVYTDQTLHWTYLDTFYNRRDFNPDGWCCLFG